jgi:hypothetical protein
MLGRLNLGIVLNPQLDIKSYWLVKPSVSDAAFRSQEEIGELLTLEWNPVINV